MIVARGFLPFDDPDRRARLVKVATWLGVIAAIVVVLNLLGVDVSGWLSDFWDALSAVEIEYIVAGLALQTVQTALTAVGWYWILRYGYPDAVIPYRSILAAYAAGVAMNGFLPANIGTFASLLMYTALIAGATFPGVLGGMVVQKIFYTVAGTAVYLYLFLSVSGSFSLQLGWFESHRLLGRGADRGRAPSSSCCSCACSGASCAVSGRRPSRAAPSSPSRRRTSCACSCRRSGPGSQSWA